MTPIVDGLRYESGKCALVKYTCPVCDRELGQAVRHDDTEGVLIRMMPHGICKDAEVLIRVR